MASEIQIANLALSRLGDTANVSSITPPEGSPQAVHCARFLPVARDKLLESHAWWWADKRAKLTELAGNASEWQFQYAMPPEVIRVHALYMAGSKDPQEFALGIGPSDEPVVYANVPEAILHYTKRVVNTSLYSAHFTSALSWALAAELVGPMLKDNSGRQAGMAFAKMAEAEASKAAALDANQQHVERVQRTPAWIQR